MNDQSEPHLPEVVDTDLGGLLGGLDLGALMGAAQDMQQRMAAAQAELAATTVEGSAGGGLVTVEMTGDGQVQRVSIAPQAVDPDDLGMLEDLLVAAWRDASSNAAALAARLTSFDLGGLGGLLGG